MFMSMRVEEKRVLGGDLLPSIEKVEVAKALSLSFIITEVVKRALLLFLEKNFSAFDAPVGDNSCKIRAVRVALIAKRFMRDLGFSEEFEQLLKQLELIAKRIQEVIPSKKTLSLKEFRVLTGIEFEMSSDVAFLVRSHFLFLVKREGVYEGTNPAILQQIAPIANSTAKDWIFGMKQELARASVEFVRKVALTMKHERAPILQKMVADSFVRTYEKRPVLSNTHSMEILFREVLRENLFVVFKSGKETILFHSNSFQTALTPAKEVDQNDVDHPAIVIEAEGVNEGAFFDKLLARAAQDPQYLDGEKSEPIVFDLHLNDPLIKQEQRRFSELAQLSVSFRINHILCDRVGSLIKPECSWHSCNWMGDDLNIKPGSWSKC